MIIVAPFHLLCTKKSAYTIASSISYYVNTAQIEKPDKYDTFRKKLSYVEVQSVIMTGDSELATSTAEAFGSPPIRERFIASRKQYASNLEDTGAVTKPKSLVQY
jgi:hypothetical protein